MPIEPSNCWMLPQRELERKNITFCLSSPLLPLSNLCLLLRRLFFIPPCDVFPDDFFPPLFFFLFAIGRILIFYLRRFFFTFAQFLAKQSVTSPNLMFMQQNHKEPINNLTWSPVLIVSTTTTTTTTAKLKRRLRA